MDDDANDAYVLLANNQNVVDVVQSSFHSSCRCSKRYDENILYENVQLFVHIRWCLFFFSRVCWLKNPLKLIKLESTKKNSSPPRIACRWCLGDSSIRLTLCRVCGVHQAHVSTAYRYLFQQRRSCNSWMDGKSHFNVMLAHLLQFISFCLFFESICLAFLSLSLNVNVSISTSPPLFSLHLNLFEQSVIVCLVVC